MLQSRAVAARGIAGLLRQDSSDASRGSSCPQVPVGRAE